MAVFKQQMSVASGLTLIRDEDADAVEAGVAGGATTLRLIVLDNTANAAEKVYLKLWNAASATLGTTAPDMIISAEGGEVTTVAIIPAGIAFGTDLSFGCTSTAGTAGTTAPTNPVAVALVIG